MKDIAHIGCTLVASPEGASEGLAVTAVATLTDLGEPLVVVAGLAVLTEPASGSLSGVTTADGFTQPAPVVFNLPSSAEKVLARGALVVLEGDYVVVSVPLVRVSDGAVKNVDMRVTVSNAGQSKVRGN